MATPEPIIHEQSEEERVEEQIYAADDAVEVRVVPLAGELGRFSYVTERIIRSETVGKQVRKRGKFVALDGTGERGYQHRGDDITVEPATKQVKRKNWHKPIIEEEATPVK